MAEGKKYETRSVKRLLASKLASEHQKEWFMSLRPKVEAGDPLVLTGAEVPLEIFRAMDIPCVVLPWWTSICAAKQMGPQLYENIKDAGYRNDICTYCSACLGCALDKHPENGPWGGLPTPTIIVNNGTCCCGDKIRQLTSREFGTTKFYRLQDYHQEVVVDNWWDMATDDWEEMIGKERLDFYENEVLDLIKFLETETGKTLSLDRLIEVLNYANAQEEYYRKTRDLIADTIPSPVTVTDTVNAVMQAQWHRGTKWGVEHARGLYEEIKALVDNGVAAVPNEKIRLLWIGRGLWFNMAFYQHFEEKYGAAFIWTMYLGIAADGYIRYNVEKNPIRSLAARYCFMDEILHMPPFNSQWFAKECKHNHIDGVVYMVPENCMNNGDFAYNITREIKKSGLPIIELHADPADEKKWAQEVMIKEVERLIEEEIMPRKGLTL